jgi:hypothetical protein
MNLNPQENLTALEQSLKQLRNLYGNRAEVLQSLKSTLDKAELALANFQPHDDPQGQALQRKLIFTTELARGELRQRAYASASCECLYRGWGGWRTATPGRRD